MTRKYIEKKTDEKMHILKEEDTDARRQKLQKLAKEVGASTTRIVSTTTRSGIVTGTMLSNEITETEIVQNIEAALQTMIMFNALETANRNFVIALLSTVIALISAIAAWIAVYVTIISRC
jgi:adenine/guanine phosphoribosyltransferase-like PRPP-binding protein